MALLILGKFWCVVPAQCNKEIEVETEALGVESWRGSSGTFKLSGEYKESEICLSI